MTGETAPAPTLVGRAAQVAVLAAVAVAAFEAATRIEDLIRFGTPLRANLTDQGDLIVRDADGIHGRPHGRFRKFILNNYGFRGPDITERPAPGVARVMVLGASETFGLNESPGKEYPRQLRDSIAARQTLAAMLGCDSIEVVNGASLGMSLPTITQGVRLRLHRFSPSVLMAYPTPMQYLDDRQPAATPPDSSSTVDQSSQPLRIRATRRVIDQAKLMLPDWATTRLRQRSIDRAVGAHGPGWVFDSIPVDRLAAYERDLREFIGASRGIGAEPMLMVHVNVFPPDGPADPTLLTAWRRFYPRASEAVIGRFDIVAREVTLKVGRDSGVAVVDAGPLMGSERGQWFTDYSHFSDRGAGLVAGLLAQGLESLLERKSASPLPGRCAPM